MCKRMPKTKVSMGQKNCILDAILYGAPEVTFKYSGYICLIALNFFSCDQFLVVT